MGRNDAENVSCLVDLVADGKRLKRPEIPSAV